MSFSRVALATALVVMAVESVKAQTVDDDRAPHRPSSPGDTLLPANDTGIHDEIDGPKGAQGDQGTQGQLGPTAEGGDKGMPGLKGNPGTHDWIDPEAGLPGENGLDGTDGADGDSGRNGDDGSKGLKGHKGEEQYPLNGNKGMPGDMGDLGEDGVPGNNNQDTSKGDRGNKGDNGDQGSAGPRGGQGDQGQEGEQGDRSTAGANGRKGHKGDKGNDAADGHSGLPGTPGLNGRHGVPGDTGRTGAYGDRGLPGGGGPPGSPGGFGRPGNPGANGADGRPGLSGVPGGNGRDGVPGEPGPQGPGGPAGGTEAGSPGANGVKGDKGNVGLKGQLGPTGPAGFDVLVTAQQDDLHFQRLDGQWGAAQAYADQVDATKNGACPSAMDAAQDMLYLADQYHGYQPNLHLAALEYDAVTQTHELMQTAVRAASTIDITAQNTIDILWHLHDVLENKLDYYEFPDHYTAHNYPDQGLVPMDCPSDFSVEAGTEASWTGAGNVAVIAAPVTIPGNSDLEFRTADGNYTITPMAAGDYIIEHTYNGATFPSCTFVLTATIPVAQANGLRVEIIWDTATDMDLWMLSPEAVVWAGADSLFYDNTRGFGSGDSQPTLDVDDTSGFGPENMNIVAPIVGQTYAIAVHAYSGHAAAQVRIFCGGNLQTTFEPFFLTHKQFWHAADVTFAADNSCTVVSRDNVYPESPTSTTYPR